MAERDLINQLLPVLGRSLEVGFNVLDVMRHGTHEKQISNVFAWLLSIGETHNFAALGQRVLVEGLNVARLGQPPLPAGPWRVRQEVNTSERGDGADIADIVLESDTAVVVIENYETSDGHGHGYARYLEFGQREGKEAVVVLLCAREERTRQTQDWQKATVITYGRFLDRLLAELTLDAQYKTRFPEQFAFISQMHRKFTSGTERMSDENVLEFVAAMCATGEAKRYRVQNRDLAAEQFASDLAQQARERFIEGTKVMQRVESSLLRHSASVVKHQLNASLGNAFVKRVSAGYKGIYQWTINFESDGAGDPFRDELKMKFGPSAWFSNEQDEDWRQKIDPSDADYARIFITRQRGHVIRQTGVTLAEVLDGLEPHDTRLHDEMLALVRSA